MQQIYWPGPDLTFRFAGARVTVRNGANTVTDPLAKFFLSRYAVNGATRLTPRPPESSGDASQRVRTGQAQAVAEETRRRQIELAEQRWSDSDRLGGQNLRSRPAPTADIGSAPVSDPADAAQSEAEPTPPAAS